MSIIYAKKYSLNITNKIKLLRELIDKKGKKLQYMFAISLTGTVSHRNSLVSTGHAVAVIAEKSYSS